MKHSILPLIINSGFSFTSIADPLEPQNKIKIPVDKGLTTNVWMAFNGTLSISIYCKEFDQPHTAQVYLFDNELCLADFNFSDIKLERHISFYSPSVISGYENAAYAMAVLVDTVKDILDSEYKDKILSESMRINELWGADKSLKNRAWIAIMKGKLK